MTDRRAGLPRAVHVLTVALGAAAAAIGATIDASGFTAESWVLVPLAATLVASGMIQLEIQYRGEKNALDLFEAALLPLLAVFAGPGAIALTAVTKFVSQRLLGVAWPKLAFNVAQWSLATAGASVAYLELRTSPIGDMGALAAAMAVAVVINHLAVAGVLSIVQGRGYMVVLAEITKAIAAGMFLTDLVNVSFGLLFATVMVARPELSILFLAPLAVLGWAHRSYAALELDRSRIEALQVATHHLSDGSTPAAALPEVLEAIRSSFDSAAVSVLLEDGAIVTAGDTGVEAVVRALAAVAPTVPTRARATDTSKLAAALREADRRSTLVATLHVGDRRFGHLVSIDRNGATGFDDGELAIFQALAAEIAGALRRGELHDELVTERGHLFEIIDRSSDGIFTVTATGVIGDWNPAMAAITGFTADEATAGTPAALLRPSTVEGEPIALEQWKADAISTLPAEIEILTRTGDTRTLQCSFSETTSEPTSLVVTARDVTKQRELDRLRDDFVATVSHELRTPLTSIVGFTSMLLEPPRPMSDDERSDAVAMIRRGARRLERLIYNLLEVSRIENRVTSKPAPIDIEEAIENSVAELRETYPTRDIQISAGTGAVRAVGNQLSVEQILTNLLGNALKYSESGPIEITVHEAPDELMVSVTDHGPGIPAAEQERIFERFHRMDQHHVQAGTGLGLYISRRLALAMQGDLTVQSTPGEGATFSLHLPAEVHLVAVG